MSCPYSEEELEKWDGVSNPMGQACNNCYKCECEHWFWCPDDCDIEVRINRECKSWDAEDPL